MYLSLIIYYEHVSTEVSCLHVYKYYCEGVAAGQMYTYPARCWRKKRRLDNATHPRLGLYGLHLGKLSSCHLLVAYWSATFLLPTSLLHTHLLLLHLLQLMSLLVTIWNNLTKSISLRLSRTGCQSFSQDEMWLCSSRLVNLFCEK